MMGWILLAAFLLLVVYLVTAPVWLEVDSGKSYLRVRFHRLLIVSFSLSEETVRADMSFLGMRRTLAAGSAGKTSAKERTQPAEPKTRSLRRLPLKKIVAVLRTFRVKELVLHLDTGDQPTNAILYPLAVWLERRTGHDIRIGFSGESRLVFRIRSNLARMMWAYVRA